MSQLTDKWCRYVAERRAPVNEGKVVPYRKLGQHASCELIISSKERFQVGKFSCKCGHIISDVSYPSENNFFVISEKSLDAVNERLEKMVSDVLMKKSIEYSKHIIDVMGKEYPEDTPINSFISDCLMLEMNSCVRSLINCECCGRIHLQKEIEKNEYQSFFPEN